MRRVIFLASFALLAMMLLVPVAAAQETTMMGTTMMGGNTGMMGTMMETTGVSGTGSGSDLPDSGGPAILLPAAALLLGAGVLTFAVLRRR